MKKFFLAIAVVLVLTVSKDVLAQQVPVTSQINAKGTVITHITVSSKQDLDFGNDIVAGVATTVDKEASNAGKFLLAGQPNRQISIAFTLPTNLLNGTTTMPITFTTTDAGYIVNSGSVSAFNPAVSKNASFGTNGAMEIVLGGTVTPSSTQTAGSYTAPVTISLQYTTN
ncbi:MAG: DUF4402 domain-containing protein [Candidatus Kapaibacterium sp.]